MEVMVMDGWMDRSERMSTRDGGIDESLKGSIAAWDNRGEAAGLKTSTQSVQWHFACLGGCHGPCLCVSISET